MKRRTVKTFLCAALLTLAMSATACGGSDSPKESEAPAVEEEAPAEDEAPAEEEAPAEDESGAKTLEEFLKEDPAAEKELEEQAAAQGNEAVDMEIEVVGNDVICIATFKDSVELPENAVDTLSEGMDTMESAFSALAGVLDDSIGAEKGTVSYGIRYCDSDGNVIVEKSYRAE
ncbi:MAG: DUF4854 domain-containing protein [Lachnospiraceae bacterium]